MVTHRMGGRRRPSWWASSSVGVGGWGARSSATMATGAWTGDGAAAGAGAEAGAAATAGGAPEGGKFGGEEADGASASEGGEFGKDLSRLLARGAWTPPRADLRQLAADLRLDLICQ